jgi:Ca2+-binding RTX toxin-like protein
VNRAALRRITPGMNISRTVLALGLSATALTLLPGSTAHAASTCLGQPATIEASSGYVTGTPGNDVIVVSGTVRSVGAGEGADLVCLVDTTKLSGRRTVFVDTGAGLDVVDASAAGAATSIRLGPGADSFVGSAFDDYVQVGTPWASLEEPGDPGPYDVSTGTGKDTLLMDVGAVVDADLGHGDDGMWFNAAEGGIPSRVDMGAGRDSVGFEDDWEQAGAGETTLRVDLNHDLMEWHGVRSVLVGAENIRGVARRIRVRGDAGPNSFFSFGCDVTFRGGAGDDWTSMRTIGIADTQPFSCKSGEVRRAFGNAGDDYLGGGRSHDVLVGGPGRDRAHGGPDGDDICIAEIVAGKGCLD